MVHTVHRVTIIDKRIINNKNLPSDLKLEGIDTNDRLHYSSKKTGREYVSLDGYYYALPLSKKK